MNMHMSVRLTLALLEKGSVTSKLLFEELEYDTMNNAAKMLYNIERRGWATATRKVDRNGMYKIWDITEKGRVALNEERESDLQNWENRKRQEAWRSRQAIGKQAS